MNKEKSLPQKLIARKKKIQKGAIFAKQLSILLLHQVTPLAGLSFKTQEYKKIIKASNSEIGKFQNIYILGLNEDGYPFIVPKDVTKTQIISFGDQSGENQTVSKVAGLNFVSESDVLYLQHAQGKGVYGYLAEFKFTLAQKPYLVEPSNPGLLLDPEAKTSAYSIVPAPTLPNTNSKNFFILFD